MSDPKGGGGLADADIRIFESGNFADATIVCGDRTWKVHKAILSSRCKWFECAFFGNLAEAASGKIVLHEQDPDLIDTMLRFVYAREIDIKKAANGKDIPALCVKIVRVADFFLLKELEKKAGDQLYDHLDHLLSIPDGEDSDVKKTPERLQEMKEVFEAIREAYKTSSTESLRSALLIFLWLRDGRVFQLPEMTVLLEEIPDLAGDLMKIYIAGDGSTHLHQMSKCPEGIRVLEAAREGDLHYKPDKKANAKGTWRAPCILRHTPGRPSPFEVVNAKTGALVKEMSWITPATCKINAIGSHETSEIVCLEHQVSETETKGIWLRFETYGDARYYTGCHSGIQRNVRQVKFTKRELDVGMAEARSQASQAAQH